MTKIRCIFRNNRNVQLPHPRMLHSTRRGRVKVFNQVHNNLFEVWSAIEYCGKPQQIPLGVCLYSVFAIRIDKMSRRIYLTIKEAFEKLQKITWTLFRMRWLWWLSIDCNCEDEYLPHNEENVNSDDEKRETRIRVVI